MPVAPTYQPGQVLAGTVYRIIRHLATGGMGSVYEVEDTTVEKRYVLKTLHPQLLAREDLARRMRDEAKALAKLSHPNIVDVITAGVTTDAQKVPFYVMERLNGQNLRTVLEKRGALAITHAYRIASDIADALEHAHEHAIIHRDVKPENIFLHRNANGTTTTKLLDFGIIRLLDRQASQTHGKFIGTLRYASPEQVTGGVLGPATDIYSLGAVLFEMLSGHGPFDGAGDAYAIGAAHANQAPPPLGSFVRVGPEVEQLVRSALAKNPADRPRDAFTFASELRRLLREEESAPRSATVANALTATPTPTRSVPSVAKEDAGGSAPTEPAPQPMTLAEGAAARESARTVTAEPPLGVDRAAATRTSVPRHGAGATQRLAQNDTRMVELRSAPIEAREASEAREPLLTHTGPLSGEAQTRPPERAGMTLAVVLGAALTLAAMTAVVVVRRSSSHGAAAGATSSATSIAVAAPVVVPPPAITTAPDPLPGPSATSSVSAASSTRLAPKIAPKSPAKAPISRTPEVKFDP